MSDADPRTVQELGGWKDLKMVERYAPVSPEHKAEAVERMLERKSGKSKKQSLHSGKPIP